LAAKLNKTMLIGVVVTAPVLHTSANNFKRATFAVETSEQWEDESGRRERAFTHQVDCVGRLAESVPKFLQGGETVYLEGALTYEMVERAAEPGVFDRETWVRVRDVQDLRVERVPNIAANTAAGGSPAAGNPTAAGGAPAGASEATPGSTQAQAEPAQDDATHSSGAAAGAPAGDVSSAQAEPTAAPAAGRRGVRGGRVLPPPAPAPIPAQAPAVAPAPAPVAKPAPKPAGNFTGRRTR